MPDRDRFRIALKGRDVADPENQALASDINCANAGASVRQALKFSAMSPPAKRLCHDRRFIAQIVNFY